MYIYKNKHDIFQIARIYIHFLNICSKKRKFVLLQVHLYSNTNEPCFKSFELERFTR